MRNYLVILLTGLICILSPVRPNLGIAGYYWFALMRPDILAWAGPNRYSLFIALAAILSNLTNVLTNIAVIFSNSLCRIFLLLLFTITMSVVFAVDPSLCWEPYSLFLRVALMALMVPLTVRSVDNMKFLLVVVAGSIGLLGAKYGLAGMISGGARYAQGFGGMLSDNNTMALAFVVAVPLCWFSRELMPWKWGKHAMAIGALLNVAAVIFTHSRGGALAAGVVLIIMGWRSKHRLLATVMLLCFAGVATYLVRDSFLDRMSTLSMPTQEASAMSRVVLAKAAVKLWLDHPVFGVGFTETNEQALIMKYLPSGTDENYGEKVIHNTYLQMLADTGIMGILPFLAMLFFTIFRMGKSVRLAKRLNRPDLAAVPSAIQVGMIGLVFGATFLSRTQFDFFYILAMLAAAQMEMEKQPEYNPAPAAVPGLEVPMMPAPTPVPEAPPPPAHSPTRSTAPWVERPQGGSGLRMGRERRPRP